VGSSGGCASFAATCGRLITWIHARAGAIQELKVDIRWLPAHCR
jgi:hypothetical protein